MKNYDTMIRSVNFTIIKNNKDEYFFKDEFKGYIYFFSKRSSKAYFSILPNCDVVPSWSDSEQNKIYAVSQLDFLFFQDDNFLRILSLITVEINPV